MNDEDLRDCFAMLRSITGVSAEECYRFADEMLKARTQEPEPEVEMGIVAAKPRRKKSA
jgi:hypothetical protein